MSADRPLNEHELLLELLAERAAGTLSASDAQELQRLLQSSPGMDSDELELIAAAADLALGAVSFEPLPVHLRQRVLASARDQQSPASPLRLAEHRNPSRASTLAWLVTAASLLLAIWAWWPKIVPPHEPTAAEQLANLLKQHPVEAKLADPTTGQPRGDILWSQPDQQGFMRLKGLAANDPKRQQYQLWIFDEQQDDKYPIDGGVFNVDRATGEVLVPIHSALRVGNAKMFAITVEKPGGVVVSDRKRIVALGKIEG
jgi:anti-sigma-K factor RskA